MNTDPRYIRSQQKLHVAVLDLVSELPLEKITVTAIAKRANVHRSTVYEHAATPAQLLRQALYKELDELYSEFGLKADEDSTLEQGTIELLRYLRRRKAIFMQMDTESGAEIRNILRSHFILSLTRLFESGKFQVPDADLQLPKAEVDKFVISALAGMHVSIFEAALNIDEQDLTKETAVSDMIKLTSPYWLNW